MPKSPHEEMTLATQLERQKKVWSKRNANFVHSFSTPPLKIGNGRAHSQSSKV